jgi:hypothetical protein
VLPVLARCLRFAVAGRVCIPVDSGAECSESEFAGISDEGPEVDVPCEVEDSCRFGLVTDSTSSDFDICCSAIRALDSGVVSLAF